MIIGSTAIKHYFSDFRDPKDLDEIGSGISSRNHEFHWIPEYQLLIDNSLNKEFLDPDLILTLKASHAGWDIHWQKTMADILFLKKKGLKINKKIYNQLVKAWYRVHGKKSAPLRGKTADEFFNDHVKRIYNHDDIHQAVAYYDQPLFFKILKNKDSVECCQKKFKSLSKEDQIKLAKEEIFVTALERYIIPNERFSSGLAYQRSLKKFVTTMSSGWMTYFLVDNFGDLCYNKEDYVSKFRKNQQNCRYD